MPLTTLILILVTHCVGDFVLQTNWMSLNKAKQWKPFLAHITVYTGCFLLFGWEYALLNGLLHGITDFCSSRLTYKLWNEGKVHWFFFVLGVDQMIHYICLFSTYILLFK